MATTGVVQLLVGATSVGPGVTADHVRGDDRTFQAVLTGSGVLKATVAIEVSLDGEHFETQGTIHLEGLDPVFGSFINNEQWEFVRGNVLFISGLNAAVNLYMDMI